jgi:hypothetical protein
LICVVDDPEPAVRPVNIAGAAPNPASTKAPTAGGALGDVFSTK